MISKPVIHNLSLSLSICSIFHTKVAVSLNRYESLTQTYLFIEFLELYIGHGCLLMILLRKMNMRRPKLSLS